MVHARSPRGAAGVRSAEGGTPVPVHGGEGAAATATGAGAGTTPTGTGPGAGAAARRRTRRHARLAWTVCLLASAGYVLGQLAWVRGLDPDVRAGEVWADVASWAPFIVSSLLVGAVVVARLPRYGWLWIGIGVAVVALKTGLLPPAALGGAPPPVVEVLFGASYFGLLSLLVLVLLLFPTGHAPTPRWAWVGRSAVALAALLCVLQPFAPQPSTGAPTEAEGLGRTVQLVLLAGEQVLLGLCLAAAASLLVRFRRADGVERQQLKWFAVAAVVNAAAIVASLPGLSQLVVLPPLAAGVVVALLPVAVGIAVLRYRLYEIDRLISRTVSYTLLTTALLGVYYLAVDALRGLLTPVIGSSDLDVAGSTLLVAALFQPARRRLQALVDRRFNRTRYDAGRTVEQFTARLRSQVDVDQVTAALGDSVARSVEPAFVTVWVRPAAAPVVRAA